MTITMDKIVTVRQMYYLEQKTITEISDRTGISFNTVKKYIDMTNFNQPPAVLKETAICAKLTPWKPLIDQWLTDDKSAPRKQRHTALKIYDDLVKQDNTFNCSYRTVCTYVEYRRNELGQPKKDSKLPLIHFPGECQGDFGEAVFVENSIRKTGKYFVLDFPYSNSGFAQLQYGENMECLLESLDAIFRHIGGVPETIWFDNASTMVTDVMRGGGRKLTDRFTRFLEHYRIRAVFMNPASGNEKGGVESKVGYIRRRMLVPVPEMENLNDFNEHFFQLQEDDLQRCHYRKNKYISELFTEDLKTLHPLPTEQFELADYRSFKTDPTGLFTIDNKYTYSTAPECQNKRVIVKLTSKKVTVFDADRKEVTSFARLYGEEAQVAINWIPYLKAIARKPRSFLNTGFAAFLPEEMRLFLYQCDNSDRGKILSIMSEALDTYGSEEMLRFVDEAVRRRAINADNFETLYHRLYRPQSSLPSPHLPENTPELPAFKTDLSSYNQLLGERKDKRK